MNNLDDEENDWLGTICATGELCPREGYWEQIETGRVDWHQTDDHFPELKPAPNYTRARYRYIGKNKEPIK